MPREVEFQYTKLTGKLTFLLRRAREVGPPAKVNEAWLRSVKVASSDSQSIIRVLKFVHLIGRDGRPEDLWDTISKQTPENRIRFASQVRKSYKRLFNDYPDAHREDNETLRIFFDDPELGKEVVQAKLRTFRSLILFGDFDASATSANAMMNLPEFVKRVGALEAAAHKLLEEHEEIRTRMVVLEPLRERSNELHLEKNVQLQDSLLAAELACSGLLKLCPGAGFLTFCANASRSMQSSAHTPPGRLRRHEISAGEEIRKSSMRARSVVYTVKGRGSCWTVCVMTATSYHMASNIVLGSTKQ